ncbi:MAG: serine--tRNA ligase, partial [Microgenomates group bacterium]
KQLDPAVVDELLNVDKNRRDAQVEVDAIRQRSNEHNTLVKKSVSEGNKPSISEIETGKKIKEELKLVEPRLKELEDSYQSLMFQIPNVPADVVPIGADESGNVVVKKVGQPKLFDFDPAPHDQIMENLNLIDVSRAVRIGGFRSYFLKNEAVMLEQALLNFALQKLIQYGFTPMTAPILINDEAMWGTGYFPWGKEDHYRTQDNQSLAGTSEVALTAFHMGETLTEADLPIKLAGISPCFRREVGSYGKDTKGVIRVHQFMKVEQVVYTVADETETQAWHEKMLGFAEEMLQELELPYQVLLMCTGDMGAGQRKKYDVETWFPSQKAYRETHSASYFNDFQSRRLGIKYKAKDGTLKHVYTLNNTMAASPRLLAAVIENYQAKDGSVTVPEVLQPFLNLKVISRK